MTDTVRVARETGFRRFSDKILWGLVGLCSVTLATIWALTWRATDQKADDAKQNAEKVESTQQRHSERLTRLEVVQEQAEKHLQSIDAKQSQMEGKLESVQQGVNQVLIEVKKRP